MSSKMLLAMLAFNAEEEEEGMGVIVDGPTNAAAEAANETTATTAYFMILMMCLGCRDSVYTVRAVRCPYIDVRISDCE